MEEFISPVLEGPAQRDLAVLIGSGILKDFYLAGGTGAALILGHRRSYDLDFFSKAPFDEDALLRKLIGLGYFFELEKKEDGTIIGLFRSTRVSFFYYPYPILKKLKTVDGLKIADLLDIACMKVDAISSRGLKKDFVDLYMILQQGISLEKVFAGFRKKFKKAHYNLVHVRKGLVYFDGAEGDPPLHMLKPFSWREVKKFFLEEIKHLN